MKASEFYEIMAFIRGLFPRQPISEETIVAYELALAGYSAGDLKAAALVHSKTSDFFPTVSALSTIIAENALKLPSAEAMVSNILNKVRTDGYTSPPPGGTVRLSDVEAVVVETFGYSNLCLSENPDATRAHLLKLAASYRKDAITQETLRPLGLSAGRCPPLEAERQRRIDAGRE